jgi:hypothetical protein
LALSYSLCCHGFTRDVLAALILDGLASADTERLMARGKMANHPCRARRAWTMIACRRRRHAADGAGGFFGIERMSKAGRTMARCFAGCADGYSYREDTDRAA